MALRLFEATGVELEYMIVDATTLDVAPIADELLKAVAGSYVGDVELGESAWSNELVLHVLEMKTNGPARALAPLAAVFRTSVARANAELAKLGARLMPTGMHPWMNPRREMRLWPHEHSAVYGAFDRIFGCQGHGWANLQSTHLNLPFADDDEFGRLHAAIRLLLPILPALAASSPVIEGTTTGCLDNRLDVYRSNAVKIPSVTGRVIPEPVYSRAAYERDILGRLYADLAPYDPEGVLQDEFSNARGAIARFSRGSIEIRVLDVQECPAADVAIALAITAVLKALVAGRWIDTHTQRRFTIPALERLFLTALVRGDEAVVDDSDYLAAFGLPPARITMGELWRHLVATTNALAGADAVTQRAMTCILDRGPLARRILRGLGADGARDSLRAVYRQLCDSLARGEPFWA